ncbi:hypothetical protein QQX98_012574 [Neonectria punicea]|uniref:Prion-inhibition and propagation HeLo domain-containing protein n=1 Tax=Neonectria punicea TaxID=979145 RepID=A0ABR1GIK6_9HYPO
MSEPFSVAVGAIGIASAFTACVDCFGYVQLGRHFGRDFQTDMLVLDSARLRLTRCGEAARIYDDPKLGKPDATEGEVQTANDILLQILVLFADTKKISKKYKLGPNNREDLSVLAPDDLDPAIAALSNKMKELAVKRQKGSSVLKLASWALYRRSELKELVASITTFIDSLETAFPAPQSQFALAREEISQINDEKSLQLLAGAALSVDAGLRTAIKEVTGHQYSNVGVHGEAQLGDAFSSDWTRRAIGPSHGYRFVSVDKGGRALLGNMYGGTGFWDSR